MLSHVDLNKQENMVIVAISLGMGLAVTVVPDLFAVLPDNLSVITSSGIVMGSMTAIILNAVFNFKSIINPRNI